MAPLQVRILDCFGRGIEGMRVTIDCSMSAKAPADRVASFTSASGSDPLDTNANTMKESQDAIFDTFEWSTFRITFYAGEYFGPGSSPWTQIIADVSLPSRGQQLVTLIFGSDNLSYELKCSSKPLRSEISDLEGFRRNWTGNCFKLPRVNIGQSSPQEFGTESPSPLSLEDSEMYDDSDEWSPLLGISGQKRKSVFSNEIPVLNKRLR